MPAKAHIKRYYTPNPPNAFLAPPTPQAKAPRPIYQAKAPRPIYINSFLLAFKASVCQPSNPPNAPNPPNTFLAPPTPQAKAPRPIYQSLFIGVQGCRLPAVKPSKRSKPSKRLFGTPTPAGKGTKAHISNSFSRQQCQPRPISIALYIFVHGNNASHGLFGTPNPAGKGTKAHIIIINRFLLTFKPAVCQPSNAPNPPNPPNAFLAPPTPQAKAPRPIYGIQAFFIAIGVKPSKRCKRLFASPSNPQANAPRPIYQIAFYWQQCKPRPVCHSRQYPCPRQRCQTRPFWHPQPRRQRHQGLYIYISIAFYWRSRLPFASRQTLQTLQPLQTPFWHPHPRRQRHQGLYIISFFLAFKPAICRPPNPPNAPNLPNAFLAPPTPQAKAPRPIYQNQIAFYSLQTLQTLQTPFWHPQPRRQRHQGPYINSFLYQ